jgi:hypothetical protein
MEFELKMISVFSLISVYSQNDELVLLCVLPDSVAPPGASADVIDSRA